MTDTPNSNKGRRAVCPICGADVKRSLPTRDRMHAIEGSFTLMRCRVCGVGFLKPQPSEDVLARHYPDTYYTFTDDDPTPAPAPDRRLGDTIRRWSVQLPVRVASRLIYHKTSRQFEHILNTVRGSGRCLDIGCGQGLLLDDLRTRGWQTFGIDVSQGACDVTGRKGHAIFCGEVIDAPFPDGYFELITLIDSIEHVRAPMRTLAAVRRLLSPTGRVVIATPNINSWLAQLFHRWYWQLDSPRHLYVFSPCSLAMVAQQAGLAPHLAYTRGNARGIAFSVSYFLSDLLAWPKDRFVLSRDAVRLGNRVQMSFIGALLDLPCLLADACNKGDTLYMHLAHDDAGNRTERRSSRDL